MEDRLNLLKAEMHCSQDQAVQRAAKNVGLERSSGFQKKGHQEQQHDFNKHVTKSLEEAVDEIGKRPMTKSALDKARQVIKEGLRQFSERKELIKIADRLQYG